jgi:hypothetical protein
VSSSPSLTTEAGGNDTIYGDGDPIVIAPCHSGLGIADWVNGTGLTIRGTTLGVTYTVSQGDLGDAGHFEVSAARAGIDPAQWPGVGLGISANTSTGRDGSDHLANGSNPEINPTVNGQDQLGFGLPTGADALNICFGTFYGRDGTSGARIESAWVLLGQDTDGNGVLAGAEVTGKVLVLADGTVLQQQGGFVAAGHAVAPDGSALPQGTGNAYAASNPGRFSLTIQTADGAAFQDVALESGGLWQRQPDGTYTQVQNADPSDFLVRGLTYNPAAGNDTIFGGGGDDTIIGGGDRGSFSFTLNAMVTGSAAKMRDGVGYYFTDTKTGEFIDNRVLANDINVTNVDIAVASNRLDKIGFFIVPDVAGSRALDKVGAGTDVTVSGPINLTPLKASGPGTVTAGSTSFKAYFDGIRNPSPTEGKTVPAADRVAFGTVSDTLATTGRIGLDDRGNGFDGDYNDVVLQLTLSIGPDAVVGDRLTGNAGADTFIWNGAGSGALAGSRADGFDLITDFQAGIDTLRFDEFSAGSAQMLDVTWQGQAAVLVFDSTYAAGTGVLIENTRLADLQPGDIVFF